MRSCSVVDDVDDDDVGDRVEGLGEVGEVLDTPLSVTETVSIRPAPLGPSMVSVLSDLISPALTALLGRSHGMGVRRAPPRLSSLPRAP